MSKGKVEKGKVEKGKVGCPERGLGLEVVGEYIGVIHRRIYIGEYIGRIHRGNT